MVIPLREAAGPRQGPLGRATGPSTLRLVRARIIDAAGTLDGRRLVAASWIATSRQPRPASRRTGHRYGHGWFTTETGGRPHSYGWAMAARCCTSSRP